MSSTIQYEVSFLGSRHELFEFEYTHATFHDASISLDKRDTHLVPMTVVRVKILLASEDAGIELNEIESLVMKTLFLMRHAKSSRNDPSLPDRERPLDDRGRHEAPKMGKRLTKRGVKPDLLVSSPALRALTTAQLIADELGYQRKDIVVDERLYASSPDDLLAVICALDDKLDRVMLFGHNPEFSDLAHRLWSEIIGMPTCAVAEFRFDAKAWADVGEIGPAKVKLDAPKK